MSIGYACSTIGVPFTNIRSCMIKNATKQNLLEITTHNLNSLENIIEYNIKNHIKLFRINYNLIPFGSSKINNIDWWNIYESQLLKIGDMIKKSGMRVSMNAGQCTVLNSSNEEVLIRTIDELNYHTKVLDSLGIGEEHKIIIHIGGIYKDKKEAIDRFITNYNKLDESVKRRLVIKNDDKLYNISDVIKISKIINVPVIFDNLYNKLNPSLEEVHEFYWIEECKKTWKEKDGYQKIHYSQQYTLKNPGYHSKTIIIKEFLDFYEELNRKDIDIMLEVKDKNLSAIKCINCTSKYKNIKIIEDEWSKYKYTVLENSHIDYLEIRKLLKNKGEYPVISFYTILERAMQREITLGGSINAAQHVWGYFKGIASDKEKSNFLKNIEKFKNGEVSIKIIKNDLLKMAIKYQRFYLLNYYYFVI